MNNRHIVGKRVSSFELYDKLGPITGIALLLDDENELIAGDDTGYMLEVSCPYGTQAIADDLLAKLQGKTYQGYRAQNAVLDPTAELGDGITVNGIYSLLAHRVVTFGPGHMSEIAAPGESALEHEYSWKSPEKKEFERKLAQTRSLISKTAEEVKISVEELNGKYTALSVTLDGVTITDPDGTTKIKGSSIETSSLYVDAAHITGKLTASQVEIDLSGSIKWTDLSADVQNEINDAYAMAEDAEAAAADAADTVDGWRYNGGTYIDGSMVMAGTVIAGSLIGGEVGLLTAAERQAGGIEITGSSSSSYAIELYSNAALRLAAYGSYASVYLEAGGDAALGIQTVGSLGYNVTVNRSLIPNDSGLYCGRASYKWEAVYAETETIQTSDANKKTDIEELPDKYVVMFDLLTPKRARMINGTSGRYHPCYIAQEVKAAMDAAGIDSLEFGGWVRDYDEAGNEIYMLRYGELDPIRDAKIKQLDARLTRLEENA